MRHAFYIALLSTGCTWISYEELETAKQGSDNDGDGFIFTDDCNDSDPNINPAAVEEWYNGIDQNCDGLNDYDADGDGYVAPGYEGALTDNNPDTVINQGGDCNDEDSAVFPDAIEVWYDGVDQDCGGENDYDADMDGFEVDNDIHDGDDCNDDINDLNGDGIADGFAINPGATEIWYDGTDQDCGGESDFDIDGDGYVPDGYEGELTDGDPESAIDLGGDCDDNDLTIFPDAVEVWYDGIDQDCGEENDFDADMDGYAPTDLVLPEGLTEDDIGLPLSDCNDSDPNSYLGNIEVLSDTVSDRDCDGSADTFLIAESENIQFTNTDGPSLPSALRLATNNSTAFVSFIAENLELNALQGGTTATYYKVGLAIEFDIVNLYEGPTDIFRWQGFTALGSQFIYELNQGHSIAVTDDYFMGALGLQLIDSNGSIPTNRALRIGAQNLNTSTFGNCLCYANEADVQPFEDVDLMIDSNNRLHAIGCESYSTSGFLQYLVADPVACTDNTQSHEYDTVVSDIYTSQCRLQEFDSTTGIIYTETDNIITPQYFDSVNTPLSLTPQAPVLDDTQLGGNDLGAWQISDRTSDSDLFFHDNTTIYMNDNGVPVTILDNVAPDSFSVQYTVSDQLLISYVNTNGDAVVAYGDIATGLDSYTLNVGFAVNEIVAYSDDDQLLVAVLGTDKIAYGTARF